MTSKRFIHKRRRGLYSSEKSAQMNKARWDADRARREAEMPERLRELAEIEMMNLPRKIGLLARLVLGSWHSVWACYHLERVDDLRTFTMSDGSSHHDNRYKHHRCAINKLSENAKGMTRGLAALEPESTNQLDG